MDEQRRFLDENNEFMYFVRHGETEANRAGILQGHCDYPLTDKGLKECSEVGIALKAVKFSKVFSSDLKRTLHTSEILLSKSSTYDVTGKETLQPDALLREMSFGVRETQPRELTIAECIKIVAKRDGIEEHLVVDTAETVEEIIQRQKCFITEVLHPELLSLGMDKTFNTVDFDITNKQNMLDKAGKYPRILVVSHGAFIKRFLKEFCDKIYDNISNCSITVVTIEWSSNSPHDYICHAEFDTVNVCDHISKEK